MGVFSNKYLEYLWVVMLHLLLLIYTYHGVNIDTWLKLSKLTMLWQNCYHIIADSWMISVQYIYRMFVTLLKTYTTTHCYWKVVLVVTNKTFLDLYILGVDNKFITGVYHKVDDFKFEVISYPFPQSNVHSMLGYSTYYSQLIRFFRLCNNINDFLFRAKFSYSKLVKRGYKHSLLLKYRKRFCLAYNIEGKYGEKNSDLLCSRIR